MAGCGTVIKSLDADAFIDASMRELPMVHCSTAKLTGWTKNTEIKQVLHIKFKGEDGNVYTKEYSL